MSDPIDLRVIRGLQNALAGISTSAGYHFTVESLAVKLDPNHGVEALLAPDGPRPFMVLELGDDTLDFIEKPDGIRHTVSVTVHWVSESIPTDDASRLETFLRGCADIEQAINVDRSFGGLAMEAIIRRRRFNTANDGSQVWAEVHVDLVIVRTYGRPNG